MLERAIRAGDTARALRIINELREMGQEPDAELANTLPVTFEEIEVKGAEDPAYRARGIFYVTVCGVAVEYDSRRA